MAVFSQVSNRSHLSVGWWAHGNALDFLLGVLDKRVNELFFLNQSELVGSAAEVELLYLLLRTDQELEGMRDLVKHNPEYNLRAIVHKYRLN